MDAAVSGATLTVDPADGFIGEIWVTVTVSDGASQSQQTFTVTVEEEISGSSLVSDEKYSDSADQVFSELDSSVLVEECIDDLCG